MMRLLNKTKKRILIVCAAIACAVIIYGGGCDRLTGPDKAKVEIEQFPFPNYVQPGLKAFQKTAVQLPENYCYVSTLNGRDAALAYTYRAFRIDIPKGLVKKTEKKDTSLVWVTFRYGSRHALSRIEADTANLGRGGIVRIARCLIPNSEKIVSILFDKFTKFGKASWLFEFKTTTKAASSKDSIRVASDWTQRCIDWGSWCIGGERCEDPNNWTPYCKEYVLVYEGNGGGGSGDGNDGGNNGGGGEGGTGGGSNADPCSPGAGGGIPIGCTGPPPYPPAGISPAVYEPLTDKEKELCWDHPTQCYYVYQYSEWAENWAAQVEPVGPENGPQDAIRHTAWSGRITLEYNAEIAENWTDAHEWGSTHLDATVMDQYNNAIGRQIGSNVSSLNGLKNSILNNYENGNLCTSLSDC